MKNDKLPENNEIVDLAITVTSLNMVDVEILKHIIANNCLHLFASVFFVNLITVFNLCLSPV